MSKARTFWASDSYVITGYNIYNTLYYKDLAYLCPNGEIGIDVAIIMKVLTKALDRKVASPRCL